MNRMEYCSVSEDREGLKAYRVCRHKDPTYVKASCVKRTIHDDYTPLWMSWSSWGADYTQLVSETEVEGWEEYIPHEAVKDDDVELEYCWAHQKALNHGEEVDLQEPVEIDRYNAYTGDALRSGDAWRVMVESREDRVYEPEDHQMTVYEIALHNYKHNPSHKYKKVMQRWL